MPAAGASPSATHHRCMLMMAMKGVVSSEKRVERRRGDGLCYAVARSVLLFTFLSASVIGTMGRSQSHDPGLVHAFAAEAKKERPQSGFVNSPLPRPLAGLERIASGPNVCRKGHGALPCKAEIAGAVNGRAGQDRGRPSSQMNTGKRQGSVRAPRYKSSRSRALSVRRARAVPTVEGEELVWSSAVSGIAVYERTLKPPKELPEPGGGGEEDGEGGPDGMPLARREDGGEVESLVKAHVWGHPRGNFSSVFVFPYDSRTRTCSVIRQYCPGTGRRETSLPGGRWDGSSSARGGADLLEAARTELRAEAGLDGGTWVALCPDGIPQDANSKNRVHPFLVIDSQMNMPLGGKDGVEVEHGVRLDEVMRRVYAGEMLGPAAMASMMALDKLNQLNL